ncbi:MAG: hypothetical protein E6I66_10580 [Chloroflexi bacterium]|nr:MAG: hypothetical protein E6I66_10580 [Chloroflexota bacterium]
MTDRRFQKVDPISRETAAKVFTEGGAEARAAALLSLAYHDPDWRWVQNTCLELFGDRSVEVRAMAALCLGHLARIHRSLDLERVLPALESQVDDPVVGPRARDALDDISVFMTGEH